MSENSSPVDPAPVRVAVTSDDDGESAHRELAVVGSTSSAFQLPSDWLTEEKTRSASRSAPRRTDRYYIEPHTGKKFRSLVEVERYLSDGTASREPKPSKRSATKSKSPKPNSTLAIKNSANFVLPEGWKIQEHQRSSGTVDKYYIEPNTGLTFRSMISVKRHLQELETSEAPLQEVEESEVPAETPEPKDPSVIQKKVPPSTTSSPGFVLPEGWITKKQKRQRSFSSGITKCYVEPETGKEFRSLAAVERYLKRKEEDDSMPLKKVQRTDECHVSPESENADLSQETSPQKVSENSEENKTKPEEVAQEKNSGPSGHSDTQKENNREAVEGFGSPPSSLNWVLAGPAGDTWNPYSGEFVIPDTTRQKWSDTFLSSIRDGK